MLRTLLFSNIVLKQAHKQNYDLKYLFAENVLNKTRLRQTEKQMLFSI